MESFIEKYINTLQDIRRLSPHTCSNYQQDLTFFKKFCETLDLQQFTDVTTNHVRQFVAEQTLSKRSTRTAARRLSAIKGFYQFGVKHEWFTKNPAAAVPSPKIGKKLPKTLDVDAIFALLQQKSANSDIEVRDLAILELFYSSGLRLSELVNLPLEQIDLTEGMLKVTGKGNKARIVPVGKTACERIRAWLAIRQNWAGDDNALFISQKGQRLTPRAVQKRLATWGIKHNLDSQLHPHRLRHSFASHILESSNELRAVQELLGHENLSTTQIYTHLNFQQLARVYDKAHPRAKKPIDE